MCASSKKRIKQYFQKNTEKGIVSNKAFQNFIKPFLINKSSSSQNDVVFIEKGKYIFQKNALAEVLHDHNVKIVEKSYKIKPQFVASLSSATGSENVINEIIQYYGDHASIKSRVNLSFTLLRANFKFKQVPESDTNKILKNIDGKNPVKDQTIKIEFQFIGQSMF